MYIPMWSDQGTESTNNSYSSTQKAWKTGHYVRGGQIILSLSRHSCMSFTPTVGTHVRTTLHSTEHYSTRVPQHIHTHNDIEGQAKNGRQQIAVTVHRLRLRTNIARPEKDPLILTRGVRHSS